MSLTPLQVARAALQAYVDKDRAAIEALLVHDFRFTSPLDNAIDRATYLARCWPNSEAMSAFELVRHVGDGERVFIIYEATTMAKRIRNCELHTVRDGRLVSVEVYFGWDLPHRAAPGGFVDDDLEAR